MSNKTHPEPRQGKFSLPLIAIIAGGVVLIFATLLITMGRSDGVAGSGGAPAIAVDQDRIDFGDVKLDTPLTFRIQVTNNGDSTLRFKEKPTIEVVEGC